MKENRIQINNNEVESFHIITCPICGFTFRLVDMKTRKKKEICPLCGGKLFGLDFNKFTFINRDLCSQNIR